MSFIFLLPKKKNILRHLAATAKPAKSTRRVYQNSEGGYLNSLINLLVGTFIARISYFFMMFSPFFSFFFFSFVILNLNFISNFEFLFLNIYFLKKK